MRHAPRSTMAMGQASFLKTFATHHPTVEAGPLVCLEKPSVRGRHLTRMFGTGDVRTTALQDVSLDLYRGQIVLLMGPSGSGKSTLLAVLSGLLQPDSGQVVTLGRDLWQLSEPEREEFRLHHCGFIFQGYNL